MDSRSLTTDESCFEESRYSCNNSHDVREIKQMLLSGSKDEIAVAAGKVLSKMNNSELAVEMINSDIPDFLCDVILPFDSYISGTIYSCLAIMTSYEHFFTQNHSSVGMETVIRSMHFLIKNGCDGPDLKQPLELLMGIVRGYIEFDVAPEKKPFEDLMNLVIILLKQKFVSHEVRYQTGLIIKTLFEMELWKFNCLNHPIELCVKWFDVMCLAENCSSPSDNIIHIGCALSELTLRYLTNNEIITNQFSIDFKTNAETANESSLVRNLIVFLVEFAAPRIGSILPSSECNEMEKLERCFMSLAYIFKELFPQRYQIAQRLSEMGFIQLITNTLSHPPLNNWDKLGELCVCLLFEILLSLSDDVFLFPDMWPSGRDHFRKEILSGMSLLPLNPTQWINMLSDEEVNRSSRLALILYFYFHLLTVKSPSSAGFLHPSVVKLLNSSVQLNSSPLVVKTVWFTFVMSQMSENSVSPSASSWAVKKMLEILETQKEFSLIYTHHPAVLYWTFLSSQISCRIQCEVAKLWLENRSLDCTALDDLVKKSADVRLAVFQLLQSKYDHIAHLAFSTLKTFMLQCEDDALSCNIWFVLPQTLAKYTTDTSTAVTVDYIVELAALKIPERPDLGKMARIATLLPKALEKSDLISLSSALRLALQLLQTSIRYEDSRVLLAFLRCDSFLRKIISGMATDLSEVASTSIKIIIILWKNTFHPGKVPSYYNQIIFDSDIILNVLSASDSELIRTGLELTEQMLSTNFKSNLLFVQGLSSNFIKILFFVLENVVILHPASTSARAWSCLQHCLTLNIEEALDEDALLHEVIRFGLPDLSNTSEMVDFLVLWLERRMENENFYTVCRRINESYFVQTLHAIAEFLAADNFEDSQHLRHKVLDCCYHLAIDVTQYPFNKLESRLVIFKHYEF